MRLKLNSKYTLHFIKGYLNDYYNYSCIKDIIKYPGSYRSYKLIRALQYIGVDIKSSVDNVLFFGLLTIAETTLSLLLLSYHGISIFVKKIFKRNKQYVYDGALILGNGELTSFTNGVIQKRLINTKLYKLKIPYCECSFNVPEISLLDYLSLKDLFISFNTAISVVLFMPWKYSNRDILFRAYSSFEFFLTCSFIERYEGRNHFVTQDNVDRWAFLISNVKTSKTFIQHGKIGDKVNFLRIGTPTKAFYMSEEQRCIHERFIFNTPPSEYECLSLFDFSGNDNLLSNGKKDVLVVCNTIFYEKEKEIVKLLKDKDINLYLKLHPLTKNVKVYEDLSRYRSIIILTNRCFPKVDYVISYTSTLADEYASAGVNVIMYDGSQSLSDICNSIQP